MRPQLPFPEELLPRLQAAHASGWYANFGPQEVELRHRFSAFLGVDAEQIATASSATLALQGAIITSTAKAWSVPSFTFPATAMAVLQAGCDIHFADVDAEDWWIDVSRMPDRDRPHGIMAVAPFGTTFELARWDPAREVIIDAAASLGSDLPSLSDLSPRWAVVFSLHATKCLPAGEGGIVVFGSADCARRFRAWTNFGFDGSRESTMVATNAKLSEHAAVVAHASLDGWVRHRREWLEARAKTDRWEAELGLLGAPGQRGNVSPYWVIQSPTPERAIALERSLNAHGVQTRRWWVRGCHNMPPFVACERSRLDVTEQLTDRVLGLPMYRGLEDAALSPIASAVHAVDRQGNADGSVREET